MNDDEINEQTTNRDTKHIPVIREQNQASVSHRTKLPKIYEIRIANDIKIDGIDPKIPRIFGSTLSPI